MTLSDLDYFLIALLLGALIFGGIKGILPIIAFVASLLTSLFAFTPMHILASKHLAFYQSENLMWKILLFLALIVVSAFIYRLISRALDDFLEETLGAGWVNHVLGALFFFGSAAFLIYFGALVVSLLTGATFTSFHSITLLVLKGIFSKISL